MLRPVVMLPGLLCDAGLYRPQIDALADVAAVQVADLTLDSSVQDMARRVLTVAPPRFALVALSMGGYVAFEILRRAPERVERVALLSTSAAPDDADRREQRRQGMQSLRLGRFMGVTQRLLPQLIHPSRVDEPLGEAVRAMAERVGSAAYLRQQQAILSRPDSRPMLDAIAVPTLVAVGDADVLTPPVEACTIHSGIRGSILRTLPNCGHLPTLERPEETTALLRSWLEAERL